MMNSLVESQPPRGPGRGLPPPAPPVVLRFEKPVGFPHDTQNLASSGIAVPQYWQVANWRSRFPFFDRLFESKPLRRIAPSHRRNTRVSRWIGSPSSRGRVSQPADDSGHASHEE